MLTTEKKLIFIKTPFPIPDFVQKEENLKGLFDEFIFSFSIFIYVEKKFQLQGEGNIQKTKAI